LAWVVEPVGRLAYQVNVNQGAGPSPTGGPVVPGPPFEIGAPSFHAWPPGCYTHPILYFLNVAPPSGFCPPLLLNPGDGPVRVSTYEKDEWR